MRAVAAVLPFVLCAAAIVPTSVANTLGNLSPYHKAPVPAGIREDLPEDCVVDRVVYVRVSACKRVAG